MLDKAGPKPYNTLYFRSGGVSMYELIQLSEHDYYIDCPAKIGLVQISDDEVVAIDSGNDKDAGKKVLRHIEAKDWKLKAIYNTHSHADHIGGNRFLQEKTGCRIYAKGMEAVYSSHPELEPMTLFGGYPFKELTNKFLMAQSSTVEMLTAENLPEGWHLISLPGHCFDMVGFETADGNVFLGDCVSSEQTLQKYGIGYLWNPIDYISSLEHVVTISAKCFVPSHAPVCNDIVPLAQKNIEAVRATMNAIVSICSEPITFEEILGSLFSIYSLTMNAQQYALIGSTVRSYLSCLYGQGRLTYTFQDNQMLWHSVMDN